MAEERRFEQGQRLGGALSHRTLNTMLELVRQQRLGRLGSQGGDAFEHTLSEGVEVLVSNETDDFQSIGSVLSLLQGTPLDPDGAGPDFLARPCFHGTVPLATSDLVAVLRDGIEPGEVGLATVQGLAIVTLDWTSTSHQYAQPVANDSSQMASATSGHRIVWTATGATGQQQAVVLLGRAAALDSPLTTKGDIWVYGTSNTRLPGPTANGQVLTGDLSQPENMKWATPSSGGGSGIEVKDLTGTPDYTTVTCIITNESGTSPAGDGLYWTQSSGEAAASQAELHLAAADLDQPGGVTTGIQRWKNTKWISGGNQLVLSANDPATNGTDAFRIAEVQTTILSTDVNRLFFDAYHVSSGSLSLDAHVMMMERPYVETALVSHLARVGLIGDTSNTPIIGMVADSLQSYFWVVDGSGTLVKGKTVVISYLKSPSGSGTLTFTGGILSAST